MSPILYVFFGIFAGALLIGLVLVVVVFFREIRQLRESIDGFTRMLKTMNKDNTLAESMESFREMISVGKSLMLKVSTLNTTVDLFYKVALRNDVQALPTMEAPENSSAVFPYDETAAAEREQQAKIRKFGGGTEPPPEEMPRDRAMGAEA